VITTPVLVITTCGVLVKFTVSVVGHTAPTTLLYRSVTVNCRVLVTQQVIERLAGVMVRVYGSPAVMVMSVVFVIVLPMAAASIVATPGCVPEVAMAVAWPAPPSIVAPERKASISASPVPAVLTVTVTLREARLKPVVITLSTQAAVGPDKSIILVYGGLSIVTVTSPMLES